MASDDQLKAWRACVQAGELVRFRLGGNERIGRVIMDQEGDNSKLVCVRLWVNATREWDLRGPRSGVAIPRDRLFPVAADDKRRKSIAEADERHNEWLRASFGARAPLNLQNVPALQNPTPASLAIRDACRRLLGTALKDLKIDYTAIERQIAERASDMSFERLCMEKEEEN